MIRMSAARAQYPNLVVETAPLERVAPVVADDLLCVAREIYMERRRRDRFFPSDLFGEPRWDILLDLYIAAREDRRVPTTSACIGANVPPTTALRWLRILEERGFVEREGDRRDGRRTFVRLTAEAVTQMENLLRSTRAVIESAARSLAGQGDCAN